MMNRKIGLLPLILSLSALFVTVSKGQRAASPSAFTSLDEGLAYPHTDRQAGQKDFAAVSLIQSFITQVNSDRNSELCGTGAITLGNGKDGQLPASLAIDGNGNSRLDISESGGVRSIRMTALGGGVLYEDGSMRSLPISIAAAGMFPAASVLSGLLADPDVSLNDDGDVVVGSEQYHSLTYAKPLLKGQPTSNLIPPLITQLLFDPRSGLLVKAIDGLVLSDTSRSRHLRVITFADYQKQGSVFVPMHLSETLDGQSDWQISLAQVPACSHPSSYFAFAAGAK